MLPAQSADANAEQEAKLLAAIRAANDLNDARARALFDELLASAPPDRIAAKAYLHLGIIDFNALDLTHARDELRRALELDPTIEIPPTTSPKIVITFEELRRKLAQTMRATGATAPAPAAAVSTSFLEVDQEPRHVRVWPWVLGAAAVVAVGVSVLGWVEVANFEQLKGPTPVTPAQALSAQSAAEWGEPVGIVAAVAAVGLGTGTVLTW